MQHANDDVHLACAHFSVAGAACKALLCTCTCRLSMTACSFACVVHTHSHCTMTTCTVCAHGSVCLPTHAVGSYAQLANAMCSPHTCCQSPLYISMCGTFCRVVAAPRCMLSSQTEHATAHLVCHVYAQNATAWLYPAPTDSININDRFDTAALVAGQHSRCTDVMTPSTVYNTVHSLTSAYRTIVHSAQFFITQIGTSNMASTQTADSKVILYLKVFRLIFRGFSFRPQSVRARQNSPRITPSQGR